MLELSGIVFRGLTRSRLESSSYTCENIAMTEKSKSSSGLLKSMLVIFLPLITTIITANYQYIITRWEESDGNYRKVVSEMTSKNKDVRHAAAASLGTYVKAGNRYFSETIDILTNRLSSESNHNVRNSIIGSLKKIKNQPEYRQILDRLLTIDRNNFIQDYQIKTEVDKAKVEFDTALLAFQDGEQQYANSKLQSEQFILKNLAQQAASKHQAYQSLGADYNELQANKPIVSNMISIFLSEKQGQEIVGLNFFRSTMSDVVLTDLILPDTNIKWASFGLSILTDSQLTHSSVERTYFNGTNLENVNFSNSNFLTSVITDAILHNTNFSNSRFDDVFFFGSDLRDANFTGVSGLKPEYFYGVSNLELAKFDDIDIVKKAQSITENQFRQFVANSKLGAGKKEHLIPGITK